VIRSIVSPWAELQGAEEGRQGCRTNLENWGMYGPGSGEGCGWLRKAIEVAENDTQKQHLAELIRYYETGDLEAFNQHGIKWWRKPPRGSTRLTDLSRCTGPDAKEGQLRIGRFDEGYGGHEANRGDFQRGSMV